MKTVLNMSQSMMMDMTMDTTIEGDQQDLPLDLAHLKDFMMLREEIHFPVARNTIPRATDPTEVRKSTVLPKNRSGARESQNSARREIQKIVLHRLLHISQMTIETMTLESNISLLVSMICFRIVQVPDEVLLRDHEGPQEDPH
jgi:hypothetical protein